MSRYTSSVIGDFDHNADGICTGTSWVKHNHTLLGEADNDHLYGDAGSDYLAGGEGGDTYRFGRGSGQDTLYDYDTNASNTDVMQLLTGIMNDQIWLRRSGDSLEVSIIGTADAATVSNWYTGPEYQLEQIKTSSGQALIASKVNALVEAMAAFAPPAAGQTTLPTSYQTALNGVIAESWKP